ncbi:hypothetical protein ACP275_01G007500 [Erythranthe tilingii]
MFSQGKIICFKEGMDVQWEFKDRVVALYDEVNEEHLQWCSALERFNAGGNRLGETESQVLEYKYNKVTRGFAFRSSVAWINVFSFVFLYIYNKRPKSCFRVQ